jgi:hypothetical protein
LLAAAENIFCVKNDGNVINGGSGSVGRMGRRGGGGDAGVAFDAIGRTIEAENGLSSCSLDEGGRMELTADADVVVDRSDVAMFGLGEEGLTTAVVVVGTGVDDDLGGELCGDDVSRLMNDAPSSSTYRVDEDVRCLRRSSSSSSSSSSSVKSSSTTCCRKKCECDDDNKLSMLKADIFLRFASAELAT